jgi:rhodanese-related sulfurtransferase
MKTLDKPTLQDFHIEGVKHITPSNAIKLLQKKEAVLIDVREMNEIEFERIDLDNVLYYPMTTIADKLSFIAKDQNIILICPGGTRSTKVANMLNRQGYPNVANLDGGFLSWIKQNLPFKTEVMNTGSCGCGCSSTSANSFGGSCC